MSSGSPGMEIEFTTEGIHLPEIALWLDPQVPVEAAWLSHAHSDHARAHHVWAAGSRQTLALYQDRWPDSDKPRRLNPLTPGETVEFRGARLTAFRAAHILGSAQLLIEYKGERVVYTGDIKLQQPLLGWETEVVPCDRLIIESTFGLPVFHFLTREEGARRIETFARDCLDHGEIPAFFGYPLGRGQEIAYVLTQAGIPTAVHGAIARYIPYYEKEGYSFPGWEPYQADQIDGRALVVTHALRAHLEASSKRLRMALVSGWAMFDSARARSGADELIPYSDHAGYRELLDLIDATGARTVDIVHGYSQALASVLTERGYNAIAHHPSDSQATRDEVEL